MAALLSQIIDDTASRLPAKEAFRFDGSSITYGELAARSNQLAHSLLAAGVASGDLVGIYMGKSLDNATSVYGIQKAGAAYVPLDTGAPPERIERILAEGSVRHVVSEGRHAARLPDGVISHFVGVDTHDSPTSPPALSIGPDHPAYVIFTSGSTGAPKGIVHTHASGLAYARMAAELYQLRSGDRLSNFPPLHFDQSTFDFFSGPLVGATTVIIGEGHQLVPASLSQLIERERLTVWYSVPFALIQLLHYGVLGERDLTSLRWVIYGGEPFPLKHLKALMDRWPHARFSNCYGPAETNQCTYHHLEPLTDGDVAAEHGVPIGRACEHAATLLIDPDGTEVAPGQAGELLISSPTTMQGYWNEPELSAAAFLQRGERRYYRTGDLARYRDDGLLEFLGRKDRQVKTRGYRVELDEVEAMLLSHPDVRGAAVYPVTAPDTTVIRASVIMRSGADLGALRRYVSSRLPGYAVPDTIDLAEDLPRMPNGKTDYRALAQTGAVA